MGVPFKLIISLYIVIFSQILCAKSKNSSPYSMSVSSGLLQAVDEDVDSAVSFGLGMGYRFSKKMSLGASLSFYNTFTEYEDPYNRGLEDLNLSLNFKSIYKNRNYRFKIDGFVGVLLPSSETSRDATLNAHGLGGVKLIKRIKRFTFTQSNAIHYLNHKLDTADVAGFTKNYNYGIQNDFQIGFKISKKFKVNSGYTFYNFWDYESRNIGIQSGFVKLIYGFTRKFNSYLGYNAKSQVVSNLSLFDGVNATVRAGFSYAI